MKIKEIIQVALEGVWVNKLRSALTMLGMIIGVMSIFVIITLGQSLEARTTGEVESMGGNSFNLTTKANDNGQKGEITLEDCRYIEGAVENIQHIVPLRTLSYKAVMENNRKKKNCLLIGTSGDYPRVSNLGLAQGRYFTEAENTMGRRVVIIDQKLANELFNNDAVGKNIKINNWPYEVIGVSKSETPIMGMQFDYGYIPIEAMMSMESSHDVQQVIVKVYNQEQMKSSMSQCVNLLEMRHGVKKGFEAGTNEQMMEQIKTILTMITSVFGALAGIALLVGGIGIMNIMLVSTTERTREIGIRIAIGARRRDILLQFLAESVVISVLGGAVGIIVGISLGSIISLALKMPVIISFNTIILAFMFSAVIGMIFGIYPANRAAHLNPIEALRYE